MTEQWTLASIWNLALNKQQKRSYEPRERLWASELYGSDIDIVLKLRGEQPTNKPDDRALRKMEAGNMTEEFVNEVLRRAGILKSTQDRISFKGDGMLEVSGKLDFLAGGTKDNDMIEKMISECEEGSMKHRLLTELLNLPVVTFDEKILEIKSLSLFAFNKVEATGKPLSGHGLQAYHYARNKKMEAAICYICRDDLRMIEIPIFPFMEQLEEEYLGKIKRISDYYYSNELPPIEPLYIYDSETGTFGTNFKVQYSNYLTKLYGFNHPEEYGGPKGQCSKKVKSWNSVLKRIREDKPMTKLNEEYLEEMRNAGFDVEFIKNNQAELASKGIASDVEEYE